jgi:phosphotransferase system  glucose/maltose/N-acetylglucosamine-specific IIC component
MVLVIFGVFGSFLVQAGLHHLVFEACNFVLARDVQSITSQPSGEHPCDQRNLRRQRLCVVQPVHYTKDIE